MIDPTCSLWGDHFSPRTLKEIIPEIIMRQITEPGELHERGRLKGQSAQYGYCSIAVPESIEIEMRIEWMADFIATHMKSFTAAGATEAIYWLLWTGVQGNMEFSPTELQKIARLGITLCVKYIHESSDE